MMFLLNFFLEKVDCGLLEIVLLSSEMYKFGYKVDLWNVIFFLDSLTFTYASLELHNFANPIFELSANDFVFSNISNDFTFFNLVLSTMVLSDWKSI